MRDQHWLGMLKVCAAGHRVLADFFRALNEDADAFEENAAQRTGSIPRIHPHECGDLIVTAAASPERPSEVLPYPLDEDALECAMNVLVGLARLNPIREVVLSNRLERCQHRGEIVRAKVSSTGEGTRVGGRGIEVIRDETPINVRGLTQPLEGVIRTRREATTP